MANDLAWLLHLMLLDESACYRNARCWQCRDTRRKIRAQYPGKRAEQEGLDREEKHDG